VFTIGVTPANPTNVYYVINFGDGSPVNLPVYYSSNPTQVSYTYQSCGIYSVNVTVFNKVSSFSQILPVNQSSNLIIKHKNQETHFYLQRHQFSVISSDSHAHHIGANILLIPVQISHIN